jgi:hypothetical protein
MSSAFLGIYPFNSLRKRELKNAILTPRSGAEARMVCRGWDWCMVECAGDWIWSHRYIFTIILTWPGWKLVMWFWNRRKEKRLTRLSTILRKQADESREREPNIKMFNPTGMARHLGKDAKRIDEVLEFMREKGWAGKTGYKNNWWIL